MGAVGWLGEQCPSKGPLFMQGDEFPPNILGNSGTEVASAFARWHHTKVYWKRWDVLYMWYAPEAAWADYPDRIGYSAGE